MIKHFAIAASALILSIASADAGTVGKPNHPGKGPVIAPPPAAHAGAKADIAGTHGKTVSANVRGGQRGAFVRGYLRSFR